ncbi:hypothetical protein Ga0100231_010180 [Opitutaceae bacterium TAV4]|uniref:hypothetical protein n=1 Tax=Geminisphaera colitermitum TaxID=1148786 RepID=UPI0001964D9B|nr:hypothetical protein [Geminisphaera colitermitum]RRJ94651.1 hypothetical protein Ga0100231_010180 [Opitutaceae bacterium TAV4]
MTQFLPPSPPHARTGKMIPLLCAFIVSGMAIAATVPETISLAGWTAKTDARATASIATEPQELAHAANTMAADLFRVNYHSPERANISLVPPEPVPLPDDLKNLTLWFARAEGDFTLLFNIRDAAGAHHELKVNTSRLPHGGPVGWKQHRAREWSIWSQATSYRIDTPADIAERAQPEYQDATRALVWPRPLSLAGITIKPAKSPAYDALGAGPAVKAGTGSLFLAELTTLTKNGFEAAWSWTFSSRCRQGRDTPPVLFLDDLTLADADTRYEVTLHRGYQGPVIWSRGGEASSNRKDPVTLFRQRILLPELPRGRYFLNTKTWKPDGTFNEDRQFLELVVIQNRDTPPLPPPGAQPDSGFQLRSDMPSHVFPHTVATAALRLTLPAARTNANATVHVRIVDYNNRALMRKNFPRPTDGDDLRVSLPVEPGMEYFATAELLDNGRLLDRAHLHFGVESPPEPSATRVPDSVPDRDAVLSGKVHYNAEYWEGDRPSRVFPWINNMEPAAFELFLQQAVRAGAKSVSIGDLWGNHEMLPGVYQWHELDRRIERAAHHGLKAFLAYTGDGSEGRQFSFPLWLDAAIRIDQAGDTPSRTFAPSWWDPAVRDGWLRYYKRLVTHVLANPNVIGYRITNYQLAGKTAGWGVDPSRLDYSAPARAEFARWIGSLNKTPDRNALPPPPPPNMGALFSLPGVNERDLPGPDLSEAFQNFVNFNTYSHHARLADFFAAIRSLDPRRQIQVDQKPFPYAIERSIPLLRDGGVLKNEDSPNFNAAVLRSMCVQAGVPYAEELHNHMPTSRSISDATNFWSSYLSDGIFWLMRWHSRMIVKNETTPPAGGFSQNTAESMLDYQRDTLPAWEEWIRARQIEPEVLVFGSRAQGLLANWRSGGDYDIEGIRTFNALFAWHQVPPHFANEYTDWVRLDRFKTIFVCGEVMPLRAIERLVAHVRGGGGGGNKIVLVGNPGKYCPERPAERDLLRRLLRDTPGIDFTAQIREIAEPRRQPAPGVPEWQAPFGFPAQELDAILAWAGVTRRVSVKGGQRTGQATNTSGAADARFECQLRASPDGNRVYVAIMRKWTGGYLGNIDYERVLKTKYGLAPGTVTLAGLGNGRWRVEKFHRDVRDIGSLDVTNGSATFEADAALAGEVQLFRLTRDSASSVSLTP